MNSNEVMQRVRKHKCFDFIYFAFMAWFGRIEMKTIYLVFIILNVVLSLMKKKPPMSYNFIKLYENNLT